MSRGQEQSRIQSRQTDRDFVLFVGNPGAGKSTLLNGLIGRYQFEAGFSVGTGMSDHFVPFEHKGVTYCDTPGLLDTEKRKVAAEQIKKALQQNGTYRLFFVITLEAGRLRSDDAVTMSLVLQAIEEPDISFSVIINRIQDTDWEFFTPEVEEKLRWYITKGVANEGTAKGRLTGIFFVKAFNPGLKYGEVLDIDEHTPNFRSFVEGAVATNIRRDHVGDIKVDGYKQLAIQMQSRLDEANAKLEQTRKEQAEANEKHRREIKRIEEANETSRDALIEEVNRHVERETNKSNKKIAELTAKVEGLKEELEDSQNQQERLERRNRNSRSVCPPIVRVTTPVLVPTPFGWFRQF